MNRRDFVRLSAALPLMASAPDLAAATPRKPYVVLAESCPVYQIGGAEARILVGGDLSHGEWWLGSFRSDAGRLTSLHVHHGANEQFYGVEGVMSVWVEGEWHELPAGACAVVPSGIPHALGNRSKHPARYVVLGNPAGFEHFFPDIEIAANKFPYGSSEFFAEVKKIYLKYDSELLGPAPE